MARPDKKTQTSDQSERSRARLYLRVIFGIALFGALLTVHLWIQSERGFSQGCFGFSGPQDSGVEECTTVVSSDAGKLFGISNIVYGFFFFGTIAALGFASILTRADTTRKLRKASLAVSTIGVLYALFLFGYQVFALQMFCQLCLTTGLTTAILFGVHAVEWAGRAVPRFELAELVREIGLYILMVLIAGMLLVAQVFFLNRIGTLDSPAVAEAVPQPSSRVEPAAPSDPGSRARADQEMPVAGESARNDTQDESPPGPSGESEAVAEMDPEEVKALLDRECRFDGSIAPIQDVEALTRRIPFIGPDTADVIVIEIFDPNCPHCKQLYEDTSEIMARIGGRAKLYYRPHPLWPFSYAQIEALYLAQDAGLFHEMLQGQMDRQQRGGLSVGELTQIADRIGMDPGQFRRDLSAGKYRSRVNRERVQISRLGIRSVPKVAIDGRFLQSSSVNPICIDHLVDRVELEG